MTMNCNHLKFYNYLTIRKENEEQEDHNNSKWLGPNDLTTQVNNEIENDVTLKMV